MTVGGNRRIFVQIASYRDPECQWTVKDLFEKAADPDRISVGICWQFVPNEDQRCFQQVTRPDQVRIKRYHAKSSLGVCWARHHAQRLFAGEEYTLQIDSHMRFVPGWDELMIEQLKSCDSDRSILSSSPAAYTPPNELSPNPLPTVRRAQFFNRWGEMRFRGMMLNRVPDRPLSAAFIAAGYMFSSSSVIREVPYDPYMAFNQEEASLAARYFTSGWDMFSPDRQLIYHYYRDPESSRAEGRRPLFGEDKAKAILNKIGLLRFHHLMGHRETRDSEVLIDLRKYGLGTRRTLDEYIEYCGVDYRNLKVDEHKALRCGFVGDISRWLDRVYIPELDGPEAPDPVSVNQLMTPAPRRKSVKRDSKVHSSGGKYTEVGSFLPLFELRDDTDRQRYLHLYGGKPTQLYFLPASEDLLTDFFSKLDESNRLSAPLELYHVFVVPCSVALAARLRRKIGTKHRLWADPQGRLIRQIGGSTDQVNGIALSPALQVRGYFAGATPGQLIRRMRAAQEAQVARSVPPPIGMHAPVLVVKDVLGEALCHELIEYWAANERHQGGVGAGEKAGVRMSSKVRTDCFIKAPELHARLDERLSRTLFPEIEKIFGLNVTRREDYKVGCYSADDAGFFSMHRDNYEFAVSYRRFAMTLVLSDKYEGGELRFPEYSDAGYALGADHAIVFPCALVHQVTPVTVGSRFVLVSFFYGEPEARHRDEIRKSLTGTLPESREWAVGNDLGRSRGEKLSRFDNLPRDTWQQVYSAAHNKTTHLLQARYGPMILLKNDTRVCREIEQKGVWCQFELDLLSRFLTSGAVAVDGGAYVGNHTLFFARSVGPAGHVHAFEPQRVVHQLLNGNVALNGLTNVTCYRAALSDSSKDVDFPVPDYVTPNNYGAYGFGLRAPGQERVRAETLDGLKLQRCDLIKLNVQGSELSALQGAFETIESNRPVLYVENDQPDREQNLLNYLKGRLRYQPYRHAFNLLCLPIEARQEAATELEQA